MAGGASLSVTIVMVFPISRQGFGYYCGALMSLIDARTSTGKMSEFISLTSIPAHIDD